MVGVGGVGYAEGKNIFCSAFSENKYSILSHFMTDEDAIGGGPWRLLGGHRFISFTYCQTLWEWDRRMNKHKQNGKQEKSSQVISPATVSQLSGDG